MPETFDLKALEKRMDGALASLKTEFTGRGKAYQGIHVGAVYINLGAYRVN